MIASVLELILLLLSITGSHLHYGTDQTYTLGGSKSVTYCTDGEATIVWGRDIQYDVTLINHELMHAAKCVMGDSWGPQLPDTVPWWTAQYYYFADYCMNRVEFASCEAQLMPQLVLDGLSN